MAKSVEELTTELKEAKETIAELERYITRPTFWDTPPVLCPPENKDAVASIFIPYGLADKNEFLESIGKLGEGEGFYRRLWIHAPDISVSEVADGAGVALNIYASLGVNHSDHWGMEAQMMMSIYPDLTVLRSAVSAGQAKLEILFHGGETDEITFALDDETKSRLEPLIQQDQTLDEDEWLCAVQEDFSLAWFPKADLDEDPRRRLVETEISSSWTYWFCWEG